MASYLNTEREGKDKSASNADLLLHPELLSQEFMQMILHERKISAGDGEGRDRLTELYLQHVIPLPQRKLPDSRWGKRMERSRARQTPAGERSSNSSSYDHNRKRPQIAFGGSSSHSGPIKLKKPEGTSESTGLTDRLKPPPTVNLSNPVRKLSSSTPSRPSSSSPNSVSSSGTVDLKREADSSGVLGSPEVKKKIHHVTWP